MKRWLIVIAVILATAGAATAAVFKAPLGSRTRPYPFGAAVKLKDGWVVKVLKVTPAAWPLIHAENEFNKAPAVGRTFYMVRLKATYQGR